MKLGEFGILLFATSLAGQTIGVIRSGPLPSPQDAANLESRVLQNPEDIDARVALLQFYLDSAPLTPNANRARSSVRLQHILYLVEHHPELEASASKSAYVYRDNGPYADPVDHDAVRNQWLASVQAHPKSNAVTMNAVKFLEVEDQNDAEQILQRALDSDPGNRELGASLGFLYAKEILGDNPDLSSRAAGALDDSSNAIVLAAAGTALPNLAVKSNGGRVVDPKIFDLANQLSARARQLAPDDADIQGPMPLIKYFAASQEGGGLVPPSLASPPSRIRIGENVQKSNIIRSAQPQYPEEARAAGITGEVRFVAIIGRDGTIQNLQLVSGHPLLVEAAKIAATTWLYKPTLLNGAPVEVVTTITISFPAK